MNALFKTIKPDAVPTHAVPTHNTVQAYEQNHKTAQVVALSIAEEVPVALVYNGISQVVLMATPQHLVELAEQGTEPALHRRALELAMQGDTPGTHDGSHLIAGLLRIEQRMGTERSQGFSQRLGGGWAIFLVLAVVVIVVGAHIFEQQLHGRMGGLIGRQQTLHAP